MRQSMITATCIAAAFTVSPAWAHGEARHAPAAAKPVSVEEKAFGKAGNPEKVNRSIAVDMSDKMRFTPAMLSVKSGEIVKFVVTNSGKIMHEFVLGTLPELKEHSALMKKFPGMEHDEPYMAHVAPGKTETIVWQFTKAGEFHFGCLLPGHFEAGMIGRIKVLTK